MGLIITVLIVQWVILLIWVLIAKIEEDNEWLPSFYQALSMIIIPFSAVILLLLYLKKVEKENKEQ